jgi:hypothetical protein
MESVVHAVSPPLAGFSVTVLMKKAPSGPSEWCNVARGRRRAASRLGIGLSTP